MIQIDDSRCIGCGLCVGDCFPGALLLERESAGLSAPENCIGCGHCIAICPQNAVSDDALPMDDVQPAAYPVEPEKLLTLMRSRRSCRRYKPEPIPETVQRTLLEAARACPTAKNLQETRYVFVTEQIPLLLDAALEGLGRAGERQLETAAAPDERRRAKNFMDWAARRREDKHFDPLFFHAPMLLLFIGNSADARDAASAASYTELMAAALGLGCLYSGYFTACAAGSDEIRGMLGLGEREQVTRCLVLGYPDVKFQRTAPRKTPQIRYL